MNYNLQIQSVKDLTKARYILPVFPVNMGHEQGCHYTPGPCSRETRVVCTGLCSRTGLCGLPSVIIKLVQTETIITDADQL